MGSIRLETLTDYARHGYDIEVACGACGHRAVLTPDQFFARGELGDLRRIEKRLRCGQCRERAARVSSTSMGPSGGTSRPIRDWREK